MQFLKANTAIDVLIGPFVDTADGYTAITTGTIDVELSKNGQALANKTDVTAPTHDAAGTIDGYFNCELDATDTNEEGCLVLVAYVSTALPVRHEYMVLAEAAYDSMFTAKDTGYMDVNIKAVSEDTTAADNAEAFFDGTGYAGTNNVIPTVTTLTGHTAQTGDTYALANGLTGFSAINTDVESILAGTVTNAAGADIAADIIAVKAETASILEDTGTTLDGKITDLQGVGFVEGTHSNVSILERGNAAWTGSPITSHSGTAQAGSASTLQLAASGASAIDDTYNGQVIYIISGTGASQSRAIADYTGSTTTATVVTNWATAPDNTSVYEIYPDEITEITAAPDADTVAGAVWDLSTTTHTQGGTFGEQLKTDLDSALTKVTTIETDWNNGGRLDLILDTIAADTTTDIPALIATAQADLDTLTGTDGVTLATTQALYAPAKAGDNMGTVSSVTGNVDGNVTGNVGGNVVGSVATVADSTAQTGDTFALANGLTGFAAIDTVVDAIKVKTDGLNFTGTEVDANVEQINGTTVLGAGTSGDKWRA